MGLSSPWADFYLKDCKVPPDFDHQTVPTKYFSKSDEQTLIKTQIKMRVLCDDDEVNQYLSVFFLPLIKQILTRIKIKPRYDLLATSLSIIDEKCDKKTGTFLMTFHKPEGEDNMYV